MSDNMNLLTPSQEYEIFTDQTVGSVMTLLEADYNPQPFQSTQMLQHQTLEEHYNIMYEVDEYQNQFNNQNNNTNNGNTNCNEIVPYSTMPVPIVPPPPPPPPPPLPPAVPQFISSEEYSGPFDFEVLVDPHYPSKSPWVYSVVLNKIFIAASSPFPVDFRWTPTTNLFVRATPVFSLAQHSQDLVVRCLPHSLAMDQSNRNEPEHVWNHVIRCQNTNAQYLGSKEENIHLSVRIPLEIPQMGTDSYRALYKFMCKNSCPSGMNRRPFEVVFTLEDERGTVHGRQKINVRVCSCPKRDKEKEEKDYVKEHERTGAPPLSKRQKIEKTDKKSLSSPLPPINGALDIKEYPVNIRICGKHNQHLMIKYAYDLTAGEILRHGPNENLKKCLETLETLLKNPE